jgi:type IV pilus modification protein PilV
MLGKHISSDRGLSLLEVLISMLILAFGVLGLAPMMILSVDANSTSRDFAVASELAKESLEFYESSPGTIVAPYSNTENNLQGDFSRQVYILDHASDSLIPDSRYKLVVVISWMDGNGLAQSTQMSTLIKKES